MSAPSLWPSSGEKGYLLTRAQILREAGVPEEDIPGDANINFYDLPQHVQDMIAHPPQGKAAKEAAAVDNAEARSTRGEAKTPPAEATTTSTTTKKGKGK